MTQEKNTCLVLLGMHRSGISTLAGCLKLMGVNFGATLAEDIDNQSIALIHDILLRDLGYHWDMVGELPQDWLESEASKQATQRLTRFIERRFLGQGLWGVNDPRMCRLMPLWNKILESLDITPRMILVIRHPLEVAKSLNKNNDFDLSKGHLLWMVHYMEALRSCRGHDRAIVTFDKILASPFDVLKSMAKTLDITYPVDFLDVSRQIIEFVRPEFKHHHAGGYDESDSDQYSHYNWVYKQLYMIQTEGNSALDDDAEVLKKKPVDIYPDFPLVVPAKTELGAYNAGGHAVEIFKDLLTLVGRSEQRERDLSLKKERLLLAADSTVEPLFLQVYYPLPFSEKQTYIEEQSKRVLLAPDEWQEIRVDISRPELLRSESLRLDPLNTRGVATIAAVKLVHATTGEVCWAAQDAYGFSKCRVKGDGFVFVCGDNLTMACTGRDPQLLLPPLPDLPDAPMYLVVWIKVGRKQSELQTAWSDLNRKLSDQAEKLDELETQLFQARELDQTRQSEVQDLHQQISSTEKTLQEKIAELETRESQLQKELENERIVLKEREAEGKKQAETLGQAQSEIEKLNLQISATEKTLQEKIAQLESREVKLQKELENERKVLKEKEAEGKKQAETLRQTQSEVEKLNSQISALEKTHQEKIKQLEAKAAESLQKTRKDAQAEAEKLHLQISTLEKNHQEKIKQLEAKAAESLQKTRKDAQAEAEKLTQKMNAADNSYQEHIKELKNSESGLLKNLADERALNNEYAEKIKILDTQILELNKVLQDKKTELNKKIESYRQAKSVANTQVETMWKELIDSEKTHLEQVKALKNAENSLYRDLEKEKSLNKQYLEKIKELEAQRDEQAQTYKQEPEAPVIDNQSEIFQALQRETQSEIENLKGQIKKLQGEAQTIRDKEVSSRNKVQQLTKSLDERERSLKARFQELATVTKMLEELQEKKGKLLNHFMWSIKSPVILPVDRSKKRANRKKAAETIKSLKEYGLVNEEWYLKRNQDVANAGKDAVEHYAYYGIKEGRSPAPEFE